jgi:hypothetical protein
MENQNHDIEKRNADLIDKQFLGIVEDANDPDLEGRCKVRIFGIHEEAVSVEDLPWAYPKQKPLYFGQDGKSAAISIPKEGSVVAIKFDNGNIYAPEYYAIQELADDIKEELQKEGVYHGSHFLLFDGDEELKIWFTKDKGISMQLKGSRVNIGQDKMITIEHDQTQSMIQLKGSEINITADSKIIATSTTQIELNSNNIHVNGNSVILGPNKSKAQPAVLGTSLSAALSTLAGAIDTKWPPTPGATVASIKTIEQSFLSKTTKVTP